MIGPNDKMMKLNRKLTTLTRLARAAAMTEAMAKDTGDSFTRTQVGLLYKQADKVYRAARAIYDGPLSDAHGLAADVWDQIHGQWCVIDQIRRSVSA